jgi:hypothetical protein
VPAASAQVAEIETIVREASGPGADPLSGAELGLLQQAKAVEQLIIRAAVDRNQDLAVQALAQHPLVDSVTVARDLLTAYRRTKPALFGQELFVRLPAGDAPHKLIDWVWLGGG